MLFNHRHIQSPFYLDINSVVKHALDFSEVFSSKIWISYLRKMESKAEALISSHWQKSNACFTTELIS